MVDAAQQHVKAMTLAMPAGWLASCCVYFTGFFEQALAVE